MPAAMNFISGGSPLGSSVVSSAANKIVGFQRGAAAVAAKPPDLSSIIKTLSTSILNNVENRVQSINQNIQQFVQGNFNKQLGEYKEKLQSVDNDTPNKILRNFLSLYKDAIGYIQFLGNRKNAQQLGENLQSLQQVFSETFEVAKIIRQTIVRIVNQLSNLPKSSPSGGAGIDLDIKVPGGPLRKSLPSRRSMLKMAGMAGAIGSAGMLGSKVVSGMMDIGGEDQITTTPSDFGQGLSGPLLDRFNAVLDRFDSAINNLARVKPSVQTGGGSSGAKPAAAPPPPGDPGSPTAGAVTATGSEQQKTESLIAGEEGVRLQAYQNPGDVPTIGYGQTRINGRSVRLGDTMTKEQAAAGLRSNIESHRARAVRDIGKESWDNIKDENSKAVLTSLAYNYGHIPKSVIPAAKSGDPKKIADAIRGLTDPSNRSYDSRLVGRRNREANFILTGKIEKADKDFLPGGKLAAVGTPVATTPAKTEPQKPIVTPASTKSTTTQQIAQTVSQPPATQSKAQVNVVPLNMSAPQTQSTPVGQQVTPPPVLSKGGASVPFLTSTNHDNFMTLYSKIVYNLVD